MWGFGRGRVVDGLQREDRQDYSIATASIRNGLMKPNCASTFACVREKLTDDLAGIWADATLDVTLMC